MDTLTKAINDLLCAKGATGVSANEIAAVVRPIIDREHANTLGLLAQLADCYFLRGSEDLLELMRKADRRTPIQQLQLPNR